ncbi:MAG: hypothetical protein JWN18_420 [Parcubacteria group bacterium]|nr:hypothetical protein [Parcubacteria group bacterium]
MTLFKAVLFLLSSVIACAPCGAQQQLTQQTLIQQVLNPLRQHIVASYPISDLKVKFVDALGDSAVTLAVAQRYSVVGGHGIGGDTPLAFSGPRPDGAGPAVIIVFENFVERMQYGVKFAKSQKEYEEYLEDLLIGVYLHEYYHIKKQGFWKLNNTRAEMIAFEADCWKYTVEEILLPMQRGGRGKLLPGTFDDTVLALYTELKGKTSDPRWKKLFEDTYGKSKPSS